MSTIAPTDGEMTRAAEQLAAGGLVAFPTETVYGLGANALDPAAARKVFEVKGRPPTDPLIVHVLGWADAAKLVVVEGVQKEVAEVLAKSLWPGPLTLVLPAGGCVPDVVTGGSGWVGVRSPRHPVARKLLEESGLCVAAPSANRFNHVSPTRAEHVLQDLAARDPSLLVIDGGGCDVGIESSVVKVLPDGLHILRNGAVSAEQLRVALAPLAPSPPFSITVRDSRAAPKPASEAMDAPGQMLTHYAPDISAFLLSGDTPASPACVVCAEGRVPLANVVVVDYSGRCAMLAGVVAAYRDLSPDGNPEQAAAALFETLRWTEHHKDTARVVLLPDVGGAPDTLLFAVHDRLFRAASGRPATVE